MLECGCCGREFRIAHRWNRGQRDAAWPNQPYFEALLTIAKHSDREEIVSLANAISTYLHKEKQQLTAAEPDYWKRIAMKVDEFGSRLGQSRHRAIISVILILWTIFVIGFITVLVLGVRTLESQVVQWRGALIVIQALVGTLMIVATTAWLCGNEKRGLKFAVSGFLLSLVAFQSLYFYLSQFQAITVTLLQLAFLLILLAYRNRYVLGYAQTQ